MREKGDVTAIGGPVCAIYRQGSDLESTRMCFFYDEITLIRVDNSKLQLVIEMMIGTNELNGEYQLVALPLSELGISESSVYTYEALDFVKIGPMFWRRK